VHENQIFVEIHWPAEGCDEFLYEAGCTYAMRRGLAHAAATRELVATERPVDWMPPSIFRPPEVLTELEAVEAEKELKAQQSHAFAIVDPQIE
jgi:hypothetical protein